MYYHDDFLWKIRIGTDDAQPGKAMGRADGSLRVVFKYVQGYHTEAGITFHTVMMTIKTLNTHTRLSSS